MTGQLSRASSIPSWSASSSTPPQLRSLGCLTAVWQKPLPHWASDVHEVAGALLQMRTTVTPLQSPSQESPRASPSALCWSPFDTRAQLSLTPDRPSASRSAEQAKPADRLLSHSGDIPAVQSPANWQGEAGPAGVYLQGPAWSGVYTSGQ